MKLVYRWGVMVAVMIRKALVCETSVFNFINYSSISAYNVSNHR